MLLFRGEGATRLHYRPPTRRVVPLHRLNSQVCQARAVRRPKQGELPSLLPARPCDRRAAFRNRHLPWRQQARWPSESPRTRKRTARTNAMDNWVTCLVLMRVVDERAEGLVSSSSLADQDI